MSQHEVPGEVVMAVLTKRAEFLNLLRVRIESGVEIPREQLLGMVDLCQEAIEAHGRDLQRINQFEKHLKQLSDAAKGLFKLENQIRMLLGSLKNDTTPNFDDVSDEE